jgi:hypothetical protein
MPVDSRLKSGPSHIPLQIHVDADLSIPMEWIQDLSRRQFKSYTSCDSFLLPLTKNP